MDIWRFLGGVCIVFWIGSCSAQSDPVSPTGDKTIGQFDSVDHIPGEPLSPMDYHNAENLMSLSPPNDLNDPIELAGLFEGDIVLPPKGMNFSESEEVKNAIIYESKKWPNGVIPYFISAEFNQMERSVIAKAFMEYHAKTCITFRPRTREADYIHISKGQGCSSLVGRNGGGQPVSLGYGCVYTGIAIHELMHAVGFWHEQSRWDRDEFIDINFNNIQSGMEFNFQRYSWNQIQNLTAPYDTSSIMHYGAYAFSRDRRYPTIRAKNPNNQLGQRDTFSKIDLFKINRLYRCSGAGQVTPAPPTSAPAPITGQKCFDSHKDCAAWAARDECRRNAGWMLINCKKSCQQCNSPCSDSNQYCNIWAQKDECRKNRDYMKTYCAKSCRTCSRPNGSGEVVGTCIDKNPSCPGWASGGECERNPVYMKNNCQKSCNLCGKD